MARAGDWAGPRDAVRRRGRAQAEKSTARMTEIDPPPHRHDRAFTLRGRSARGDAPATTRQIRALSSEVPAQAGAKPRTVPSSGEVHVAATEGPRWTLKQTRRPFDCNSRSGRIPDATRRLCCDRGRPPAGSARYVHLHLLPGRRRRPARHPGDVVRLYWIASPSTPARSQHGVHVRLTASLAGPYASVTDLKAGSSSRPGVIADPILITAKLGNVATSARAAPSNHWLQLTGPESPTEGEEDIRHSYA